MSGSLSLTIGSFLVLKFGNEFTYLIDGSMAFGRVSGSDYQGVQCRQRSTHL